MLGVTFRLPCATAHPNPLIGPQIILLQQDFPAPVTSLAARAETAATFPRLAAVTRLAMLVTTSAMIAATTVTVVETGAATDSLPCAKKPAISVVMSSAAMIATRDLPAAGVAGVMATSAAEEIARPALVAVDAALVEDHEAVHGTRRAGPEAVGADPPWTET